MQRITVSINTTPLAMGAGAGALSHAGGTLTLTSGVRGGGVAGARVCVLVLYLRFLQESQRRGAYGGQGVAVRPEVVVVDGARHARRGLRCAIGTSLDAAAG